MILSLNQTSEKINKPEIELLLCCAYTPLDPTTTEGIKTLLQQDLDWTYLLEFAFQHKMLLLLYQHLNATCPEAVPRSVLEFLQNFFRTNAQRSLFLTKELLKLLDLFKSHDIAVIPYKGPLLAASAYGNIALRQFGDLDIWVKEQDILKAKTLLLSQGYEEKKNLGWEYHFIHKDSGVNVDLHQAIAPSFFALAFDFETCWSDLQPISIAGETIPYLPPKDLLLLLSILFSKDCCHWAVCLIQLYDLAQLLRINPNLDWNQLLDQARTLGCERILLLALFLVNDLLKVDLPQAIADRIEADPVIKTLATEVWEQILFEADNPPDLVEKIGFWRFFLSYNHRFYLRMRERPQERIIYCLHWLQSCLRVALTPNETDWKLLTLPSVFYFLYYPLHLMRLVVKHCLKPVWVGKRKKEKGKRKKPFFT